MEQVQITRLDAANKLISLMQSKSEKYDKLMSTITTETEYLTEDISAQRKYEVVESIEYILLKLRLDIEFEHLQVKEMLSNRDTDASLRSIFMKRDQLLASYIIKLNSIRDDISTLQKVVYTKSSFNFNK